MQQIKFKKALNSFLFAWVGRVSKIAKNTFDYVKQNTYAPSFLETEICEVDFCKAFDINISCISPNIVNGLFSFYHDID